METAPARAAEFPVKLQLLIETEVEWIMIAPPIDPAVLTEKVLLQIDKLDSLKIKYSSSILIQCVEKFGVLHNTMQPPIVPPEHLRLSKFESWIYKTDLHMNNI